VYVATFEPEAAASGEFGRLCDFFEAQYVNVECPRAFLAAGRHRELHVVKRRKRPHARRIRPGRKGAPQNVGRLAGYGR
jgi:hypothetical protein